MLFPLFLSQARDCLDTGLLMHWGGLSAQLMVTNTERVSGNSSGAGETTYSRILIESLGGRVSTAKDSCHPKLEKPTRWARAASDVQQQARQDLSPSAIIARDTSIQK